MRVAIVSGKQGRLIGRDAEPIELPLADEEERVSLDGNVRARLTERCDEAAVVRHRIERAPGRPGEDDVLMPRLIGGTGVAQLDASLLVRQGDEPGAGVTVIVAA